METVSKPVNPSFFEDRGTPPLDVRDGATQQQIAEEVIIPLGEAVAFYRCRLNAAGVALAGIEPLPECAEVE